MTIDNGETPDGVEPPTYEDETSTAPIEVIQSESVETEIIEAQIEPYDSWSDEESSRTESGKQGEDALTRQIADGFILAWQEKGDEIIARVVEAFTASREDIESNPEPEEPNIEYVSRQHILLWVIELGVFALLFVGATYAYALVAGNLFASLVGVTMVSALILLGVRLSSMYLDAKPNRRANRPHVRIVRSVVSIYVVVLCAAFVVGLNGFGVNGLFSLTYLVVSFVLLYLSLREHYKWAEMRYRRDGNVLYAERSARSRYLLPTFQRQLILLNVNTCEMAQSWFEEKVLKMYRLKLTIDASMGESSTDYESETEGMSSHQRKRFAKAKAKDAMFWRDLKFIRRGDVLAAAIRQGSMMRRR